MVTQKVTGSQRNFAELGSLKFTGSERARETFSASDNSRTARGRTALWKWDPGIGIPHADSASAAVTVERTGAFMGRAAEFELDQSAL